MPTRTSYLYLTLTVVIVVMGMAAWLFSSLTELHDRFARSPRAWGSPF